MRPRFLSVVLLAGLTTWARADQHVIRMATLVPEGTAWARILHDFANDIQLSTHGGVRIKWYLGGIAGDELEVKQRIARDQLDGIGAGGVFCERVAPTLRVMFVPGLFRTRAEAALVLGRLRPRVDEEFAQAGFANLGEAPLGAAVVFSRRAIHPFEELRRTRLWLWNLDEVGQDLMHRMGMAIHPGSLADGLPDYDKGLHDGFYSVPQAALGFQYATRTRYIIDLPINALTSCVAVAARAFQKLSFDEQQVVRTAAAKAIVRMADVNQQQDELLLRSAFARQGLTVIHPDEKFRRDFYTAAAEAARAKDFTLVPKALLDEVRTLLGR